MTKVAFLEGERIGNWKVIRRCDPPEGKQKIWYLCECQCENKTTRPVVGESLRLHQKDPTKGSGSCGCLRKAGLLQANTKHGHTKKAEGPTATYRVWRNMLGRCTDPKNKAFATYGGHPTSPRKICERWFVFENFLEDMGERPDKTELDRIDNNGDYCPENCRWVTKAENLRNRPEVKKFEYKGELLTCGQLSELSSNGISANGIHYRVEIAGMSIEEAITKPLLKRKGK